MNYKTPDATALCKGFLYNYIDTCTEIQIVHVGGADGNATDHFLRLHPPFNIVFLQALKTKYNHIISSLSLFPNTLHASLSLQIHDPFFLFVIVICVYVDVNTHICVHTYTCTHNVCVCVCITNI